jgi:putative protease
MGYQYLFLKGVNMLELLVPAGNLNILKYAIAYGADAVYLGGSKFNLRILGKNFSLIDLKKGVDYAHNKGVKVYLTLNAIVFNNEISELEDYLNEIKKINFDGIIISDFGVIELVKKIMPKTRIHISTQANITNNLSINFWEKSGAARVNLAREIRYRDLLDIIRKTNIEIEIFVHGALCISYSGRCMLSKYMTGRDANKGKCAHSCRWKYYLMEEERPNLLFPVEQDKKGTYIYNSRDLCLLTNLELIVSTGVNSIKIEGRMKTENYVSLTTWVYRKALEYIRQNKFNIEKKSYLMGELDKTSHRNFTSGFMFLKNSAELEENNNVGYIKKYRFVGVLKKIIMLVI